MTRWVADIRAPLSVKVQGAFVLIIVVVLATALVSFSTIGRVEREAQELHRVDTAVALLRGDLQYAIVAQQHLASMMLLTGDEVYYGKLVAERARFLDALAQLGTHGVPESEVGRLRAAFDRYRRASEATVEATRAGARERAQRIYLRQEHLIARDIDAMIQPLLAKAQSRREATLTRMTRDQTYTNVTMAVLFLLAIGLAVTLGSLLARSIVHPIRRVDATLERIASGEFASVDGVVSRDELGSLTIHVNRMRERLEDVSARERQADARLQEQVESLRRTQEQLAQAEKLSALGHLVAGVAHELNNPLTAILGFAHLLGQRPGVEGDARKELDVIEEQAARAGRIVRNLLLFARSQGPERVPTSLNDVIAKAVELKRYQLTVDTIDIDCILDPSLPITALDPAQMQQVFLNLLNNAHDALRAGGHGCLTIRTSWDRVADRVVAEVADDGPGIPADLLPRIFDPFFTTKDVGDGTGLGLSICHGIVAEHGGSITVESRPGEGTTFTISLPVVLHALTLDAEALPGVYVGAH
ncbi:MAG TPA: ATP-binding protein [Methylomirabilota bacterium]